MACITIVMIDSCYGNDIWPIILRFAPPSEDSPNDMTILEQTLAKLNILF